MLFVKTSDILYKNIRLPRIVSNVLESDLGKGTSNLLKYIIGTLVNIKKAIHIAYSPVNPNLSETKPPSIGVTTAAITKIIFFFF